MKGFLTCALAFIALGAFAQNFAVLTHGSANTPEFQRGCPSNWPAKYIAIGKSSALPPELSAPWIVETESQLKARMQSLASEKELWNTAQETAEAQPKRDREDALKQAITDLRAIRDSTGTLTAAQLSNAVRVIARALLAVIEHTLQ